MANSSMLALPSMTVPGRLEAGHHRGIVGRDEVVQHARAAAGADPVRAENIFMNEGDAEQGTPLPRSKAGIGGGRIGQRLFGRQGDHGVERGIQALDPAEEVPGEFHARNLPLAKAVGELADGKVMQHRRRIALQPYSITRGTTYKPACTAGALAWYFSWWSLSETTSARSR